MKSRHLVVAVLWVVSLVGVGLWAQAPAPEFGPSMQIRQMPQPEPTGTIEGSVTDASGGVIPGVTVQLISETSGERRLPGITTAEGTFLFRGVRADTYTIEFSMPGFRTLRRPGVRVGGGIRVAVPTVMLQAGADPQVVQQPPMLRSGDAIGPVISGPDIGFQPVVSPNTPAGVVTGRLMVRIDGEWYEASAAMQVMPAR